MCFSENFIFLVLSKDKNFLDRAKPPYSGENDLKAFLNLFET